MTLELAWTCICDRCHKQWLPETVITPGGNLPKQCAKCKSRQWNTEPVSPVDLIATEQPIRFQQNTKPVPMPQLLHPEREPRPRSMGPDCPECGLSTLWNHALHRFECECGFHFKPLKP